MSGAFKLEGPNERGEYKCPACGQYGLHSCPAWSGVGRVVQIPNELIDAARERVEELEGALRRVLMALDESRWPNLTKALKDVLAKKAKA